MRADRDDELDRMVAAMARELGMEFGPHAHYPAWVSLDGEHEGLAWVPPDGPSAIERYRLAQRQRRELIAAMTPAWKRAFREAEELNRRIRQLCDERGYKFGPHEVHPADADDGASPWGPGSAGSASWPQAQRLRRQLIAELGEPGPGVGRAEALAC